MSRYDLFRKRIAPIAFVLALGLLIHEQCKGQQRIHATIVIGMGSAEPRVEAMDARVMIDDVVMGEVHRTRLEGMQIGEASFPVALPEADARVEVNVRMTDGTQYVVRAIHAEDDATIHIDLGPDLR